MRAQPPDPLVNYWLVTPGSTPPSAHNGEGGSTYADRAVVSRSVVIDDPEDDPVPIIFVAAKTWDVSDGGAGWCLTLLRYNYNTGAMIGSPYKYPANPTSTNYFVPTGMIINQLDIDASAADTRIVVTGYGPALAYGNTDYHTVCFNGNLSIDWSDTYSRPGAINDVHPVDEYPVGIDQAFGNNYSVDPPIPAQLVGITGNTWNGSNWDIQTIYYDIWSGGLPSVVTSATSDDDLACGIRMFEDVSGTYPNARSYIVGTQGTGMSNTVVGYKYTASSATAGAWDSDLRQFALSGATLKANAMQADYVASTNADYAFAAGRIAGIDQSHMLLVKFDFYGGTDNYPYGEDGYYTSFSYQASSTAPRAGEALCMDYWRVSSENTLIALGGYSYRDSSHGNDSVVVLYDESTGGPVLRWSAWTKDTGTAYDVADACTSLAIAPERDGATSLDQLFVHAACQFPTSTSDMNLRAIVFDSIVSSDPPDPETKSRSGNVVDVSGSTTGGDTPRFLELNNFNVGLADSAHNFIVIGDVWNGSTPGFDVLTRRFRFTEP